MPLKFILTDIEGTTTSVSFVYEVLFPYFGRRLKSFVEAHYPGHGLAEIFEAVRQTVLEEEGRRLEPEEITERLLTWQKEDRKYTALKNLQGEVWKSAYENGEIKGHLYDEVAPVLRLWKSRGLGLGIYSSGSVAAQKLLFGYSEVGDLCPLFSAFFDTRIGHKREAGSYEKIADELQLLPSTVLFLSDIEEELDAARLAGFYTVQLLRPGTSASQKHPGAKDFEDVNHLITQLEKQ